MRMCGRCYDEVEELFDAKCLENPEKIPGNIGMYHCPDCGAMLLAGFVHPTVCADCRDLKHPRFDITMGL